jgi:hypothetical protein
MPNDDKEFYYLGEIQTIFVNEGYTRYTITKAIERLKILGEIDVDTDPLNERAKKVSREDVARIRRYLQTGK